MNYTSMQSPVGPLLLAADDSGLRLIQFSTPRYPVSPGADWIGEGNDLLDVAKAQLDEYFAGQRQDFDLMLAAAGTSFQKKVWRALSRIPYGRTLSYQELATRIGKPTATRAVGAANGRNPLPVVVPCHRVVGADGSLTGFGGGLARKHWLLQHEGALQRDDLFSPIGATTNTV